MYTGHGRWVSIGSKCRLYVFEEGEGEATVLFESGIGATHLNWRGIQDSIATLAHTITLRSCRPGLEQPLLHSAHARQHCPGVAPDARNRRLPAALHSRGPLLRRPGDAPLRAALPRRSRRRWCLSIPCAAENGRRSTPIGNRSSISASASSVTRCQWCAAAWRVCWSHRSSAARANSPITLPALQARTRAMFWPASKPKCEKCRARCGQRLPRTGRDPVFTPGCAATSIPFPPR